MKRVAAVIRPFKLDEVRRAVADLGLQGLTELQQVIRVRTGETGPAAL